MEKSYYDDLAEGYEELYGDEQRKKMKIIRGKIEIYPETRVLDVGCGNGISSNFDCYCVGIDPSKELIEEAKKNDKNEKHEYIIEKAENLYKLQFKDKEFDYVLCVSAVHHFEELEEFLKEIERIGNNFIITVLKKSREKEKIINTIKQNLKIKEEIEEEKDIILFCN